MTAPRTAADVPPRRGRGAQETAHKRREYCGQVFRYAIATGRAERDPAADLRGALTPVVVKHHASITDPKAIGRLLRDIDGYDGLVRHALRAAAGAAARSCGLASSGAREWSEFDLDGREWRIPAERMKMREPHIVPLSQQAVARSCASFSRSPGRGTLSVPERAHVERPMSENTVNAALRRLGYDERRDDRPRLPEHGVDAAERAGLASPTRSSASSRTRSATRSAALQLRRAPARAPEDDAGMGGLSRIAGERQKEHFGAGPLTGKAGPRTR